MLPLALTWLLGTAVVILVAREFTEQAFDRSLLDDAYALSANVVVSDPGIELHATPGDLRSILFDQTESIFFAVLSGDGTLVAGQPGLPMADIGGESPYAFADGVFNGRDVRTVTLRRSAPNPFLVVMGQTTQARNALVHRLLLFAIVPQALLVLLLGVWVGAVLRRDLRSLDELTGAVNSRGVQELRPIHINPTTVEVRALASAINGLVSGLSASLAAQREFAGNVAHELRTPLAGIRALAGHGLERNDPQLWRTQLGRIVQSEERASRMVDQLLAMAFADEKRHSIELVDVRIDELVRRILLDAMPRADRLGADLGAKGIDTPVVARGDARVLEGILRNLVDNALRHAKPTAATQVAVTVEVACTPSGVAITVTDNGQGLSLSERERLLSRWQRGARGTSDVETGGGAGLGLAIVARYADLIDARLQLLDAEGGGLEVRLTLQGSSPVETGTDVSPV